VPAEIQDSLAGTAADEADPRNLFRVHWYNDGGRIGQAAVPGHVVLPGQFTGVEARIVVAIRELVPLVRAHQALAALRCPGPPRQHRAVRSDPGPGDLALHRKLLPGRCRDLPPDGVPGGGRAARGDEPGAVRVA